MWKATLLLLLATCTLALDEGLVADGNPHASSNGAGCCPAQSLPTEKLLPSSALLEKQADTFLGLRTVKHLGQPIEVLSFRQPSRLSELELPFELVLSTSIDPSGIVEVEAPPADAHDSWFPDYAWRHWVVCDAGVGQPTHLGWRFERKSGSAGPGPDHFYALIVRAERREGEGEAAARERAAAAAALHVGVEAPSWLVTMMIAVTARPASV